MVCRDAAQAIFICMAAQAELLDALISEGSISADAARPLVGNIIVVTGAWERFFPEGSDLMSEVLPGLRAKVGFTEDGRA